MKKTFLFLLVISFNFSFSQSGAKWATGLNGIGNGDAFGTSNNFPILFYTNNNLKMTLGTNGVLKLNNLSGTGNRILMADAIGNITALQTGGQDQFLLSNGTWGNLPLSVTSWKSVGNDLIFAGGNIGLGTSPAYKLDVLGDARISNDLVVGGLMFDKENGFRMYPGNSSTPDIFTFGKIGPTGPPMNLLPCLSITTLAINSFAGRMQVYDAVNNVALTMGSDGVQSTIEHSGNNGLLVNYYCGKNIYLGTGTGTGAANDPGGMAGASVFTGDKFYARKNVQIGDPGTTLDPNVSLNVLLNGTTSGLKLWSGANPSVKLIHDNYDQFTFWGNGATHFGNVIQVGFTTPVIQRADILMNINAVNKMGVSSVTTHTGDGGYNTFIGCNRNLTKALVVVGPGTGPTGAGENFLVNGDGSTAIGGNFVPSAYKLAVYGHIVCEELVVKLRAFWPDYVFKEKHSLNELTEVEKYVNKEKHLPGYESAQYYQENGIALKDVVVKQQESIEKMMLYIIELKKEVDALKSK